MDWRVYEGGKGKDQSEQGGAETRGRHPLEPPGDAFRDGDGQTLNRNIHRAARQERSTDEALGYIKGILADGRVLPVEVQNLALWLDANVEDQFAWPFRDLCPRIHRALSDGVVTEEEAEDLRGLFLQLTSVDRATGAPTRVFGSAPGRFEERNPSTQLPLTRPAPEVVIAERSFVFTGKFYFGTRIECQLAVHTRGGRCGDNVTKSTDYLVIGELGSADWVHTSYGRKIEAAATHARDGRPIALISEQHWRRFIA